MLLGLLLPVLAGLSVVQAQIDIHPSDEDRLIKILLSRYKRRGKYGRPVKHFNDTVKIEFNIQLIQIMDLDERNQVLTLNVWDRYNWYDEYLKWNPAEWGGVNKVRIPPSKIWTPDIRLYNYADERLEEHRDALCQIENTGLVIWLPQAVYKSSCEIDVSAFPFDIQNCHLKFGSWTYDQSKVDLELLGKKKEIDLSEYVVSNAWNILSAPAKRNEVSYSCCPEQYVDLTFRLIFQRRSVLYNYILILPCILLTSLTLVLFWIPPESPAKLMLGINIFVAFFLLLLLMESSLPPAAASVPLLGTYYCLNMILITLSSFLNAFVVNMAFYGPRRQVPDILRTIIFSFFGRILCMDNLVQPYLDAAKARRFQSADTHPFVGVNGDSTNWGSKEPSVPTDLLLHSRQCSNDDESVQQLSLIDYHLSEVMEFLRSYRDRLADKDRKDKIGKEWKAVGLVFDRIFFIIYLTTIVVSMCVLLPIITLSHVNRVPK
ncbi:neuronal acetylcholine receptor subunit alpha-2-like [Haliotis asinina]|uniref:neuronal acetylcholine receptor subunit alpha-2-like n=1 Tax=Haliotis asinina TaxID=109174 RepID=UPI0035324DA4